jgi:hypothetical protein
MLCARLSAHTDKKILLSLSVFRIDLLSKCSVRIRSYFILPYVPQNENLSAVLISFVTKHHKLAPPLPCAGLFFVQLVLIYTTLPHTRVTAPKGRGVFAALSPRRRYSL